MNLIITCIAGVIWFFSPMLVLSQTIINPYVSSKTHPSMMVDSVVIDGNSISCFINIENQRDGAGAWFCADKNISLHDLGSGRSYQLISSEGVPVCPDVYQFRYKGEKLLFILRFPKPDQLYREIDVIENCSDNCFSLKGIVLDEQMNKELRLFEQGVDLYINEQFEQSLSLFEELKNAKYKNENHYAYTMYIIPVLYLKLDDQKMARESYLALRKANVFNHDYFIKKIHEIEFFNNLK